MRASFLATSLLLLAPAVLCTRSEKADTPAPEIDPEFEQVTCGSVLKLAHRATGYRLHSHEIQYGSGSRQQAVTAADLTDDPNSLWAIYGPSDAGVCRRGTAVKCGDKIRLRHEATGVVLRSHKYESPISSQQEVCGAKASDEGDDWEVECLAAGAIEWGREETVRLRHVASGTWLSAEGRYAFGRPITGQLEVVTVGSTGEGSEWAAQEGVYFAKRKEGEDETGEGKAEGHDEL